MDAAPASLVDPRGLPRFGAFAGAAAGTSWRALRHGRGRLWELAHRKRWHYVSVATDRRLLAIAVIDGGIADCAHKAACLPAAGVGRVDGETIFLDGGTGAFDHTSGLLARDTRWRWASAAGPSLGFNLVEGFNGPVENVAWIGGKIV